MKQQAHNSFQAQILTSCDFVGASGCVDKSCEQCHTVANISIPSNIEARCAQIADEVVPSYRQRGAYSCTGTVAKRWQAAWDGAYRAFAEQNSTAP